MLWPYLSFSFRSQINLHIHEHYNPLMKNTICLNYHQNRVKVKYNSNNLAKPQAFYIVVSQFYNYMYLYK